MERVWPCRAELQLNVRCEKTPRRERDIDAPRQPARGLGPAPFCLAILLPVFEPQSLIRLWSMTDSGKPLICRECGKLMEFLGETPTTATQPAAQIYRCISCDRYRRFSTKIRARVSTAPGARSN